MIGISAVSISISVIQLCALFGASGRIRETAIAAEPAPWQLGDTKTPLVRVDCMNSCDCGDTRVPEFALAALRVTPFALPQPGEVSPGARPRSAGTDPQFQPPATGTAMFKIVLQPDEAALLCAIRDGLCPADGVPGSVLLSLMALRMLKCDERGKPTADGPRRGRS